MMIMIMIVVIIMPQSSVPGTRRSAACRRPPWAGPGMPNTRMPNSRMPNSRMPNTRIPNTRTPNTRIPEYRAAPGALSERNPVRALRGARPERRLSAAPARAIEGLRFVCPYTAARAGELAYRRALYSGQLPCSRTPLNIGRNGHSPWAGYDFKSPNHQANTSAPKER